ncbi:acetolactate synthase large subunit [Variovorax sp. Sphag1AA]|uniref:acetolactate synthase large subunit n=1 Tax=Variovorax sp. Sphag1AA TaxID=2587027 RepID=UPI00160FD13B|nr:acetolactate synthase large subunit [Variovorax sp. Sphag1AA]MBB3178728.1 acetolactate synthase-1/2/3 large subunit [Variovorax sp. Sphag1AA]
MNGAESLVHTLLDAGVDTCFANPGTSEMHFVSALDRIEGMRCVLGLFEGVVTGAADGYYRMADRPAATLLHLGPGLANGLANLHNAKKARSGIVNVVGEHATTHLALDAPLTSDIEGLARPMSHWVHTVRSTDAIANDGREAVAQASGRPGRIATLALPADMAWSTVDTPPPGLGAVREPEPRAVGQDTVIAATRILKDHGSATMLLLGGRAVRARATEWAGRIAAATGCAVMSEFYAERIERGAGRVAIPRLPYAVQGAVEVLSRFEHIVLVNAVEPVAFFGYPDKPGRLSSPQAKFTTLSTHAQDPAEALRMLCEELGAMRVQPVTCTRLVATPQHEEGPLTPASIGTLLATLIPENAIVVDEAVSTGRAFDQTTRDAAPHDWLTNMGGSIGFGLPVAVGAAIAAPDRKVIALEGDGSAMYTLQALWTMARESLDVTVVVFANRSYQILRGEYAQVGAGSPGQRASDMLSLDRPALDWVALAAGHGLPACRVSTLGQFADAMRRSLSSGGPSLIEVIV